MKMLLRRPHGRVFIIRKVYLAAGLRIDSFQIWHESSLTQVAFDVKILRFHQTARIRPYN